MVLEFFYDESGAVTVDWVVLTATAVAGAIAAATLLSSSVSPMIKNKIIGPLWGYDSMLLGPMR